MKSRLLAAAVVVGIGIPAGVLGLFALEGWELPTWLAVALPIVLIGSVRGTVVLLGWKALRWSVPKFKAWRKKQSKADEDVHLAG